LSAAKDGVIKFWDADTYQLIMMYNENLWEIKSICVSKNGEYIVGGGLDEGFRVWKQTSDQTIAADMEEQQREKFIIEDYAKEKLQ
jgi:WD40 repeat protein